MINDFIINHDDDVFDIIETIQEALQKAGIDIEFKVDEDDHSGFEIFEIVKL